MSETTSFVTIKFAEAKQPEYKEKKGEGYMMFGEQNDYPVYLLDLFNKSAKHGALVRSKAKYLRIIYTNMATNILNIIALIISIPPTSSSE